MSTDTLVRLLGDFRTKFHGGKFRHRKDVNLDQDLRLLWRVLQSRVGNLEYTSLKGAVYEAYVKNRILTVEHRENPEADWSVIFFYYRKNLYWLSAPYTHLHYYENYLRSALSIFIEKQVGAAWLAYSLEYLSGYYTSNYDFAKETSVVEVPNAKIIKEILLDEIAPSKIGKNNPFYDILFSNLVKYFKQAVRDSSSPAELRDVLARTTIPSFLKSLSIDSIQSLILHQWHTIHKMEEFKVAVSNGIYKTQLRDAFSIIANFRNKTYHHSGGGSSSRAVKKMRQLIPFPEEIVTEYELLKELSSFIAPDFLDNARGARRMKTRVRQKAKQKERSYWGIGDRAFHIEEGVDVTVVELSAAQDGNLKVRFADGEVTSVPAKFLTKFS